MEPAETYAEYITHDSVPAARAYVLASYSKVSLHPWPDRHAWPDLNRCFRNRLACLRWLASTLPDAVVWKSDDGVTVYGGTVTGLAHRAGIGQACRVNYACAHMLRGDPTTRAFDTCFEMGDGSEVVALIRRRAARNRKLAAALPRYLGKEHQ